MGHLIMIFLIGLICWQHKALSFCLFPFPACFPGFLSQPGRSPLHLNLPYKMAHLLQTFKRSCFCHLTPQSKAPNPLPKITSFIHWMKPNAVVLEPRRLTALQPLCEPREHSVMTVAFFGLWVTRAAHSWHQRKASLFRGCSFKHYFFMVKYYPGYFIRLRKEGFNYFSDSH